VSTPLTGITRPRGSPPLFYRGNEAKSLSSSFSRFTVRPDRNTIILAARFCCFRQFRHFRAQEPCFSSGVKQASPHEEQSDSSDEEIRTVGVTSS